LKAMSEVPPGREGGCSSGGLGDPAPVREAANNGANAEVARWTEEVVPGLARTAPTRNPDFLARLVV
jgi:hypothetical protein